MSTYGMKLLKKNIRHIDGHLIQSRVREMLLNRVEYDPFGECWLWNKSTQPFGYGKTVIAGRDYVAHRLSYWAFRGDLGTLFVCHRCDVPACINPDHLFLGSPCDNNRDCVAKGRYASKPGEKNPFAKLRGEDVVAIRKRLAAGEPQRVIGESYGVGQGTIAHINRGHTWRSV